MKQLVPDELWELIEPILPKHKPSKFGGRPRVDDRTALTAIVFVLKTGIPWEDLPQELGCSGMTAWRRLKEWNDAGVWLRLHQKILQMLEDAGKLPVAIAPVVGRRGVLAAIGHVDVTRIHRGEFRDHRGPPGSFASLGAAMPGFQPSVAAGQPCSMRG